MEEQEQEREVTYSVWRHLQEVAPTRLVRRRWLALEVQDHVASDIMVGGLRLSFLSPVTTMSWPPDFLVTRGIQAERLEAFIPTWLEEGVIGSLNLPEIPPSYFSRLFTVRKDRNNWRPIIDLSVLNLSLKKQRFKMEDLRVVAETLFPGLWGVKLDLKDAFSLIIQQLVSYWMPCC